MKLFFLISHIKGNAKAHLIIHTDEKPFACEFEGCDKKLRTKESLRRHQLSHLGETFYLLFKSLIIKDIRTFCKNLNNKRALQS